MDSKSVAAVLECCTAKSNVIGLCSFNVTFCIFQFLKLRYRTFKDAVASFQSSVFCCLFFFAEDE